LRLAGGVADQLSEVPVIRRSELVFDDDRVAFRILGKDVQAEVASGNLNPLKLEFVDL
jgi:hypothetical protein